MAYNDTYPTMEIETEEEKRKRLEQEASKSKPSFFSDLGTNLTNNLNAGIENIQNIPQNFTNNVTSMINNPGVQVAGPMDAEALKRMQQSATPEQAQYTAQMESKNNPNIGYHNPKLGTAYGTYGLTDAAYKDVQNANPQFKDKPITSLTPEEQTQAYQIYTGLNKQALQQQGLEPTPGNTNLAHFLGATGAANFVKNGTISPEAAAANGGEENVRRIAQARLAGGNAPSSGAVEQPVKPSETYSLTSGAPAGSLGGVGLQNPFAQTAPGPAGTNTQQFIDQYQNASNNKEVDNLLKLGTNKEAPEWMQTRARNRAWEILDDERKETEAKNQLKNMGPNEMARVLTKKSEGNSVGDWLQYLLYKHVGLDDLANTKGEQLGIGHKWQIASIQENGKEVPVELNTSANGAILGGRYAGTTKQLTKEQLTQAAGGIPTGVHVTKVEEVVNPDNPKQMITKQVLSDGKERYMLGGEVYTGDKSKLINYSKHVDQENRRVNAAYTDLAKRIPNPTNVDKMNALRQAGVSQSRINEEMGISESPTSGKQPTPSTIGAGAQPAQATTAQPAQATTAQPAQAAEVKAVPGLKVLPSGRPFDPNGLPPPAPGQTKESYDADKTTWTARKKEFDKRVDAITSARSNAEQTLADIEQLETMAGLPGILGKTGVFPNIPGSDAANAQAQLDKITGGAFLSGVQKMKGAGAVSNIEGEKAQAAIANLKRSQSEEAFRQALTDYKNTIKRTMNVADANIGEKPTYPEAPPARKETVQEGQTSTSKSGKSIIFRNGKWEYQ